MALIMGMDSGEWIFFEGSWDFKELTAALEDPDYCEGIEAVEDIY